jgi:hypothetical protein
MCCTFGSLRNLRCLWKAYMSNRLRRDRLWNSCPFGAGYVEEGSIAPCALSLIYIIEDGTAVAAPYAIILLTNNLLIFIVSHFQQHFQFSCNWFRSIYAYAFLTIRGGLLHCSRPWHLRRWLNQHRITGILLLSLKRRIPPRVLPFLLHIRNEFYTWTYFTRPSSEYS